MKCQLVKTTFNFMHLMVIDRLDLSGCKMQLSRSLQTHTSLHILTKCKHVSTHRTYNTSEAVFTAIHWTDTDEENSTGKYTNQTQPEKAKKYKYKIQQNKTTLVQSPPYDSRSGNEMSLFYNASEPTQGKSSRSSNYLEPSDGPAV